MKNATIIQRRLTHYRVELFEKLRDELAQYDIRLRVLCGEPRVSELSKEDGGALRWAEQLPSRYFLGDRVCWQPFFEKVVGEDLVVLPQENCMLANHLALLRRPSQKLAFWGHGGNMQSGGTTVKEMFKRWTTRQVDWYFAYTSLSVDLVRRSGFPAARITNLNNAVDLAPIYNALARAEMVGGEEIRSRYGLGVGPVGLFIGSLYHHKRVDFLLAAAERIRQRVPGFQLVIVGAGPERDYVQSAISSAGWAHYLGPLRGVEKGFMLYAADLLLNPGLVGLGVLDSFASQTPMVTTDCKIHSPEFAYLNADNALITPDNLHDYAVACADLLDNEWQLNSLKDGCRRAAKRYNLENMVVNFAEGIRMALAESQN